MKLLALTFPFITILCNPGTITDYEGNKRFKLICIEPECYYYLELDKPGDYQYVTENKKDTVVFLVTERIAPILLEKTDHNNYLFELIP